MNRENACRMLDLQGTCDLLRAADHWLILTHRYPDGDTLGSAFALGRAMRALGKKARVVCADPIPEKYSFITETAEWDDFEPTHICAVDVADAHLLGDALSGYADRVELCIDHHGSNAHYAENLFLKEYAAAAMLVFEIIKQLGVPLDAAIAESLYIGIATDTGCFKYSNTDPLTHRMAAELMEVGIRTAQINRAMFDTKSRARIELERKALAAMRFEWNGRCALMPITQAMLAAAQARENDMEGLASIPRAIEGVWVGVTLREVEENRFKVSVRTGGHANACDICARLGGGGHAAAAGCSVSGSLPHAIEQLLDAIRAAVPGIETDA